MTQTATDVAVFFTLCSHALTPTLSHREREKKLKRQPTLPFFLPCHCIPRTPGNHNDIAGMYVTIPSTTSSMA